MTPWKLPLEGGCRCGQVRLKISAAPLVTIACHCTGCQRMTASAFSLSATFPSHGFAVTQGEPVIGGLHGASSHYFCPYCMSWMFTRPEGMERFVHVRSTMLDDTSWVAPFVEMFTKEKLAWAVTGAPHSYETFPGMEAFVPLIEAYAKFAAAQPR